jgi:hypothetical protein
MELEKPSASLTCRASAKAKDNARRCGTPPNVIDFWQRRLDFLAEHLNLATDANGAVVLDGDHAKPAKAE